MGWQDWHLHQGGDFSKDGAEVLPDFGVVFTQPRFFRGTHELGIFPTPALMALG